MKLRNKIFIHSWRWSNTTSQLKYPQVRVWNSHLISNWKCIRFFFSIFRWRYSTFQMKLNLNRNFRVQPRVFPSYSLLFQKIYSWLLNKLDFGTKCNKLNGLRLFRLYKPTKWNQKKKREKTTQMKRVENMNGIVWYQLEFKPVGRI